MDDRNTGHIHAISMLLTAVISNMPASLASSVRTSLQASLDIQTEDEAGDAPTFAPHRNALLQAYFDLLEARVQRG